LIYLKRFSSDSIGTVRMPIGAAHWCNLANRIEPSMCCGDAALCQMALTTCYAIYKSH